MQDHCMELAKIAAAICSNVLNMPVSTKYSADRNHILMEFDGYPIRGSLKKGKVYVKFPRQTFHVKEKNVSFQPLYQSECFFYEKKGITVTALQHCHVYSDGHPCWDNSGKDRAIDFITNIIETISLQNITKVSIDVGHCASGVLGVKEEAKKNAAIQKASILRTLHCNPIITDHRKLENFVKNRWLSMITLYMKTI